MTQAEAVAREYRSTLEMLAAGGALRERVRRVNPTVAVLHAQGFLNQRYAGKTYTDYELSDAGRAMLEAVQASGAARPRSR